MRIWYNAPMIGTELANFSRKYFFSLALVFFAVHSSYVWSSFPFDNLCDSENTSEVPTGLRTVELDGKTVTIQVSSNAKWVEYCNQDLGPALMFRRLFFLRDDNENKNELEWMTDDQKQATQIYAWTGFIALLLYLAMVFIECIYRGYISLFRGMNEPTGTDQKIDFSSMPIDGYVPQVKVWGYSFPLLACDVDGIDEGLIGWKDKNHSYDYYNLIYDIPFKGMKRLRRKEDDEEVEYGVRSLDETNLVRKPIFSIVKYWPPEWKAPKKLYALRYKFYL